MTLINVEGDHAIRPQGCIGIQLSRHESQNVSKYVSKSQVTQVALRRGPNALKEMS